MLRVLPAKIAKVQKQKVKALDELSQSILCEFIEDGFPSFLGGGDTPLCKLHMREVPTPPKLRSGVPQLTEVPPKADRGDPVVVARTGVQKMEEYDEDVKTIGKGSNLYYLDYLIRFIYAYQI